MIKVFRHWIIVSLLIFLPYSLLIFLPYLETVSFVYRFENA